MNAPQFVLYTYPKPVAIEATPGEEQEVASEAITTEACHVYGPDSQATCEAAAASLDAATTGFMVLPLEPLTVPQSELSKQLDREAEQRRRNAEEAGGFT